MEGDESGAEAGGCGLRPNNALDPTAMSVSDFMRIDFTEPFSYRG